MRPEAVVVDDRDGYTWAKGADGKPFTAATATAYAAKLNAECKPGHQTYAVLPVGQEVPCGKCGGGYHLTGAFDPHLNTDQYVPHASFCEVIGGEKT